MELAIAGSLVSAATGFMGQRAQANMVEQQAEYNAAIVEQNAITEQQEQLFQASVENFNAAQARQETARELEMFDRETAKRQASAIASQGRFAELEDSSFSDLLDSDLFDLERQRSDILYRGAMNEYQGKRQATETRRTAASTLSVGQTRANLVRFEGENRARSLRTGALGSLISGGTQAAGYYAQYS